MATGSRGQEGGGDGKAQRSVWIKGLSILITKILTSKCVYDTWESHQALPLEESREAYNPHQAVYLIVVV